MSIVQVLVGFGLATILGLVLAEMGVNSSKQSAQVRASIERASVVQSLQAIISNSTVCEKSVGLVAFGNSLAIPPSETTNGYSSSYKVTFYLDNNVKKDAPVEEGKDVPGTSLTTEWIRAFDPTQVNSMTLTGTEKLYVTTVKVKFKQKGAPKGSVDLRPIEVGKVFFITSNAIPGGVISKCFGNNAGAYVCDPGEIQVVDPSGFWTCKSMGAAMASTCGGGASQMAKTTANGTMSCQVYYRVNSACEGAGGVSSASTCQSRACSYVTTVPGGGGGGTVTIPAINVPAHSVPSQTVTVSVPGSGTSPGSSSSVTVPGYTIPGYTIPAQNVTVSGGGGGGGTVNAIGFLNCSGACTAATAPVSCNNTAL